jgi:hypothetical protein
MMYALLLALPESNGPPQRAYCLVDEVFEKKNGRDLKNSFWNRLHLKKREVERQPITRTSLFL